MNPIDFNNPYSPPTTHVAPTPLSNAHRKPFYVVSEKKFWLLFCLTLGTYTVVWAYKHFAQWKIVSGDKIWPAARALFMIFFTHDLFKKIEFEAKKTDPNLSNEESLSRFATIVVLGLISSRLLDKLTGDDTGWIWFLGSVFIYSGIGYGMVRAQHWANIACGDPTGQTNSRLTGLNYFWMVLGGVIWLLFLFGLSSPDSTL